MTCPLKKCRLPECTEMVAPPRKYCSDAHGHKGLRAGLRVNARKTKGEDLGPALPTLGLTPAQAQARKYRIAAEMLQEGWPPAAVQERFQESGISLTDVYRKAGMKRARNGEHLLPGGIPVW